MTGPAADDPRVDDADRPCPHCGLLIRAKAMQCVHCHKWMRSPRADVEPAPEPAVPAAPAYSRGQHPVHLVTLWVLTLGAYSFYWFYRNWRDLAEITGDEIHPALRTVGLVVPFLNIYLAYRMFRTVGDLAAADGDSVGYDPGLLTAVFFSLVAVGNLFALWPVSLLAGIVTVPLQEALNRFWARREDGRVLRGRFEPYEIAVMIAGLMLTVAGLMAS